MGRLSEGMSKCHKLLHPTIATMMVMMLKFANCHYINKYSCLSIRGRKKLFFSRIFTQTMLMTLMKCFRCTKHLLKYNFSFFLMTWQRCIKKIYLASAKTSWLIFFDNNNAKKLLFLLKEQSAICSRM